MSSRGSYPASPINNLYESLHCGFTFSLTLFNATSRANLSLSFDFREGVISSFKQSTAILSPMKNNSDKNEDNTQESFFFCKTYNFGASGTFLKVYIFVSPGGTSKGPFSDSSNNRD